MCNCILLMLNGLYKDSSETVQVIQKDTYYIYILHYDYKIYMMFVVNKRRSNGFNC